MFPTFSGSSRKPRQVNLSGRSNASNPFATSGLGGRQSKGGSSHNAVANAQLERKLRQQEREKQHAAVTLQKTWRGHATRRKQKERLRKEWDETEASAITEQESPADARPYASEEECLSQLRLFLRFYDYRDPNDLPRVRHMFTRLCVTRQIETRAFDHGPWPATYLRLQDICFLAKTKAPQLGEQAHHELSTIIKSTVEFCPEETAKHARTYYRYLARAPPSDTDLDRELITAPLQHISPATRFAYPYFALEYLCTGSVIFQDETLRNSILQHVNPMLLAQSLELFWKDPSSYTQGAEQGPSNTQEIWASKNTDEWVNLLALLVYLFRHGWNYRMAQEYAVKREFVIVVSTLLTRTADALESIMKVPQSPPEDDQDPSAKAIFKRSMFVRDQILSLAEQEAIRGLLIHLGPQANMSARQDGNDRSPAHIRTLANYVLTLVRLVPQSKGDEIRMWLYFGLSNDEDAPSTTSRFSAVDFFWAAAEYTHVFASISNDSRNAIALTKPRRSEDVNASHSSQSTSSPDEASHIDEQWGVILLFIELYIFALKVMDDEAFFSSMSTTSNVQQPQNLSFRDLLKLTLFLKHLGFTMYYNATDITESDAPQDRPSISSMFNVNDSIDESSATAHAPRPNHVAGLRGMSLEYVKGLVVGLIRAIYERDSRRPFLPKDHWLMTYRFDMTSFIDDVVEEEEKRNKVQEDDADDMDEDDVDDEQDAYAPQNYVGTSRAQREMRLQRLVRQQRKASRKRYLQAVAPRLEILQNMPFLIPFRTRVQIFRRFVHLDQHKRRNGHVDPESWRLAQNQFMGFGGQSNPLERHHAKIRREHEFDDAYDQFYELGAALKEPIQITFVDKFDTVEAGIDGGGVTKEFLTSVTTQAFAKNEGIQLFIENEQRLLYPNPTAIDEQYDLLRNIGFREGSHTFRAQVSDLLQRYEFLGRIIGKCLYEGILVDLTFAGFFLLKWALTGGTGSAPKESGYRANINDLRELDEGLYQGLLQLKNYPGDVEADFDTNFTVTDTITTQAGTTKATTHELIPNGAATPVTNANRLVYISYISRHRLQAQPFKQTAAFLRGLSAIVQPGWLSMFNQQELQTLVGGTAGASINVDDLRGNTHYGGVYSIGDDKLEHPSVQLFWQVMHELADEDRRKVLKFVTSTPRAPLLGFGSLNPRFSIRDAGADETRLPSTSTCVNLLKLPRYTDKERLRGKLLQAVSSGAGFDLS